MTMVTVMPMPTTRKRGKPYADPPQSIVARCPSPAGPATVKLDSTTTGDHGVMPLRTSAAANLSNQKMKGAAARGHRTTPAPPWVASGTK